MEKLKDCPHCGTPVEIKDISYYNVFKKVDGVKRYVTEREPDFPKWLIACKNCGERTFISKDKDEVVKFWNEAPESYPAQDYWCFFNGEIIRIFVKEIQGRFVLVQANDNGEENPSPIDRDTRGKAQMALNHLAKLSEWCDSREMLLWWIKYRKHGGWGRTPKYLEEIPSPKCDFIPALMPESFLDEEVNDVY